MQHSFEEVKQLAHQLPEEQRIQLADSLYESLAYDEPEEDEREVSAAWEAEIARRLDEMDSRAVKMIPLAEVQAEMAALKKARLGG
jgi:putative addiction module component (TIGR02574 family)